MRGGSRGILMTQNFFIQPLSGWIDRRHPLPARFYQKDFSDQVDVNWIAWLSLQEVCELHEVNNMKWLSLADARKNTRDYLDQASDIIDGLQGAWLDSEEQEWILSELGHPPSPCLPIYLICVSGKNHPEEVVYVGKTMVASRFTGGHSAALKLHAPDYSQLKKKLYRATIWFYIDDEYIALDWIQPQDLALEILDSVESQLIFNFQPKLNVSKMNKDYTKWPFYIHIQNALTGGFLNDQSV
jgi:hypothetical protein